MFDVLIRVLVGWMALSCATVAGWSVLVTRYKRALDHQPRNVYRVPASTRHAPA
jgi:hypothetical protein